MTERKMDPNLSKFLHTLNEMDLSTLAYIGFKQGIEGMHGNKRKG
jgi:hypothetical protein